MTHRYHPFSNTAALADEPVSRRGSLLLLFIDLEDRLVQVPACPSGQARLTSTDPAEATGVEASTHEAEVRCP